jgi:hypothetical protein
LYFDLIAHFGGEIMQQKELLAGLVREFWDLLGQVGTWGRGWKKPGQDRRSLLKTKKLRHGKALFHFETGARARTPVPPKEKAGG